MRPGLGADTLGLRSVLCRQGSYEPVSQGFGGRSFTANYDAAAFFILWRFTCTGVLAVGLLPLESAAFREHLSSILRYFLSFPRACSKYLIPTDSDFRLSECRALAAISYFAAYIGTVFLCFILTQFAAPERFLNRWRD